MPEQNLIAEEKKPMVPGFGVAGQVMCPLSFMAPRLCTKQGCEWWVELSYGEQLVARCALAWLAILATEVRGSIDKLARPQEINSTGQNR